MLNPYWCRPIQAPAQAAGCGQRLARIRRAARCSGGLRSALLFLVFSISVHLLGAVPQSSAVTLAWNPSPSGGVSGYRVYLGVSSGDYADSTDVGNTTSITIPDLAAGVSYFFAITAYDQDGQESGFSNEVVFTPTVASAPVLASLQLGANPAGGMLLTVTGPAGRTYDLLASTDLQEWVVIGVASLGTGGDLNFVDPEAANYPSRFYRLRETQPSVQLRLTPDGLMVVSVTGQNGRTYDVQASVDLADWAVIGTVAVGASGAADFVDADAANYPTRFYRTQER